MARNSKPGRSVGRPKGRVKEKLQAFRLCKESNRAIKDITKTTGWTRTLAVERALLFASVHPDFNRRAVA